MLTLAPDEVDGVVRAVTRYRTTVNKLEAEARAELDDLVVRVQARRANGRR
jgi:hypothetical protein